MSRPIFLSLTCSLLAYGVAGSAMAQSEDACTALQNQSFPGGYVTSAQVVEATQDGPYGSLPAYCEVRATALPAISIEVRLPIEGWNGGLYQAGCGGFCGELGRADAGGSIINSMGPGLARGYATATSDSGHHGLSVVDASWAHENPQAERDWGWRSVPETNRVANVLMSAFYDETPETSIFQGCSTGGRMAMRAALDTPEMFDGIIVGAPAMDYPGLVGSMLAFLIQTNTSPTGERILGPDDSALIAEAVLDQCDAADGSSDGAVADPEMCQPDLSALMCDGADDNCLTDEEMQVLSSWRDGPRNSTGEQLYPGGIPAGSEAFWPFWLVGAPDGSPPLMDFFAAGFLGHMAFPEDPGANYNPRQFDLDVDSQRMSEAASLYNADNPDISAFHEAGGRMLVWHGWADPLVTPQKTVDWYAAVGESIGTDARAEAVSLHMLPGVDHCGAQPGPAGITQADLDPLMALERWLETGTPPQDIRR
ncbi:tannase/feruloyl esterase family alpha/beta hydrolase [Gymnodinialimonas sp. 2305UL16-5]|uniref:tannase/feruloyl esterase family alpha/beta hydrolase n=1 Tax=Gymnodinialimonas mytili TaxID=3126503 RepID=UPI0030B14A09